MFYISYQDESDAALAFSVVDVQTAQVWSPSAKAFVAPAKAPGPSPAQAAAATPADALTPLARPGGAHWKTVCLGFLDGLPDPPTPGRYLAYVHPAAGGEPVGPPVPVLKTAPPRPLNLAVTVPPQ